MTITYNNAYNRRKKTLQFILEMILLHKKHTLQMQFFINILLKGLFLYIVKKKSISLLFTDINNYMFVILQYDIV